MTDAKTIATQELAELHRYTRSLFEFETKVHGAIWATNALACGWVVTKDVKSDDLFTVMCVMCVVNALAIIGLGLTFPRYNKFISRAEDLAKSVLADNDIDPAMPMRQLRSALVVMSVVAGVLFCLWLGFGTQK